MKTQLFYQNRILSKEGMMIDTMYYVTTDWMDLYFFKFLWTDWTIQFLWLLFQLYLNRRYTRYSRKADEKWVGLHVNLIWLLLFIFYNFLCYYSALSCLVVMLPFVKISNATLLHIQLFQLFLFEKYKFRKTSYFLFQVTHIIVITPPD